MSFRKCEKLSAMITEKAAPSTTWRPRSRAGVAICADTLVFIICDYRGNSPQHGPQLRDGSHSAPPRHLAAMSGTRTGEKICQTRRRPAILKHDGRGMTETRRMAYSIT